MSAQRDVGILAVWNDCRPGAEAEYEAWYMGEHLRERVAVPGFLSARRFVAVEAVSPRYFTYYETESPDVLRSPAYLERGANPTPMTRHIMGGIFQNMTRTVCRRTERHGEMEGVYAIALRASGARAAQALQSAWPQILQIPQRVRAELWIAEEAPGAVASVEEKLRGADKKIDAGVLLEFSEGEHASAAAVSLPAAVQSSLEIAIGTYRFMCALRRTDLTTV